MFAHVLAQAERNTSGIVYAAQVNDAAVSRVFAAATANPALFVVEARRKVGVFDSLDLLLLAED